MALKSRSVQLPEEVWNCLGFQSEASEISVSAIVRTLVSDFIHEDFLKSFIPNLEEIEPGRLAGLPIPLLNEMLIFLEIKDIILSGTFDEKRKKLIDMFYENSGLFRETVNYIAKRSKYVDDVTILSWTGIPKIIGENITLSSKVVGE